MNDRHARDSALGGADAVHIACGSRGNMFASWTLAIAIASGAGYGVYRMTRGPLDWTRDGPVLGMFLIAFPVIAALMLMHAVWETLRWRKHGESTLSIPLRCGRPGEPFAAAICSARPLDLTGPAKLMLQRMEIHQYRSGGKQKTRTRCAWSETCQVTPVNRVGASSGLRAADAGGVIFPFRFDLPPKALARGDLGSSDRIKWTLTLDAPTRGPNFHASFDVPANLIQNRSEIGDEDDAEDDSADLIDDDET